MRVGRNSPTLGALISVCDLVEDVLYRRETSWSYSTRLDCDCWLRDKAVNSLGLGLGTRAVIRASGAGHLCGFLPSCFGLQAVRDTDDPATKLHLLLPPVSSLNFPFIKYNILS